MTTLFCRAYAQLLSLEVLLHRRQFSLIYEKVSQCPLSPQSPTADAIQGICESVDRACTWYAKRVLCLQRSAATACLLKRAGVQAELVIGAQLTPFRAHAWVEVAGLIVNDKPYIREMYRVLARC
jgi:hypothetical protein